MPMIVYHGTCRDRAFAITHFGFNTSLSGLKSGRGLCGVSVTRNRTIALDHARWANDYFKGHGAAVLTIDISGMKIMPRFEFDSLDGSFAAVAETDYDAIDLSGGHSDLEEDEHEILIVKPNKIRRIGVQKHRMYPYNTNFPNPILTGFLSDFEDQF